MVKRIQANRPIFNKICRVIFVILLLVMVFAVIDFCKFSLKEYGQVRTYTGLVVVVLLFVGAVISRRPENKIVLQESTFTKEEDRNYLIVVNIMFLAIVGLAVFLTGILSNYTLPFSFYLFVADLASMYILANTVTHYQRYYIQPNNTSP